MKYWQEITVWDSPNARNHIYYLNEDRSKMVGYVKFGQGELYKFRSPLPFHTTGRKFKQLDWPSEPDSVYFAKKKPEPGTVTVSGSNGKIYTLTPGPRGWMCSCPGFTFRGACRHAAGITQG